MPQSSPVSGVRALRVLLLRRPPDPDAWQMAMAPDCHVRIGNGPPAVGSAAAVTALARFLGRLEGFGFEFCQVWRRREFIYAETDVGYRDAKGRQVAIPCAISARIMEGRLKDLRFHLDPTPLPNPDGLSSVQGSAKLH